MVPHVHEPVSLNPAPVGLDLERDFTYTITCGPCFCLSWILSMNLLVLILLRLDSVWSVFSHAHEPVSLDPAPVGFDLERGFTCT